MRTRLDWSPLALLLTVAACGGGSSAASTATPLTEAVDCVADTDCELAPHADPAAEAGCCPTTCEHPVVTAREAKRVRQSWEATCSTVRCVAPDCESAIEPLPVCQAGRCVAKAP